MKKAKPFYKSSAWLKCRAFVLERDNYLCQPCLRIKKMTPATIVHHIKTIEEAPDLALDPENQESICAACHNKEHPEKGGGKKEPETERKAVIVRAKPNRERW
ncbi:HNH endonuclease [Paenibacillus sp. J31TS4]|uniref:HNH endonuclease n=1 Tax=Paenibacillus sp. J31TS4 TaxID=2807195 RepID=UPI001B00B208|nr:HNH endonuclease signature motif containing protein [Paenibacillus sp. J31TS4]GIP38651.1 HNH endonuclease [Paenibacillus sp. J31TS4]